MKSGKYDTTRKQFTEEKVTEAMDRVTSNSLSRTVRQCVGDKVRQGWVRTSRSSAEVDETPGEERGAASNTNSRAEGSEAPQRATTEHHATANNDMQLQLSTTASGMDEAGIMKVDLVEETDDDPAGKGTAIAASRAPESSERQEWRKELEQCRITESLRMGQDLDITEAVEEIINNGEDIKKKLVDIIVERKAKIRNDEITAERESWSTVTNKRKTDARSAETRGALSPRRASTRDGTQKRAGTREQPRHGSRDTRRRRR